MQAGLGKIDDFLFVLTNKYRKKNKENLKNKVAPKIHKDQLQ